MNVIFPGAASVVGEAGVALGLNGGTLKFGERQRASGYFQRQRGSPLGWLISSPPPVNEADDKQNHPPLRNERRGLRQPRRTLVAGRNRGGPAGGGATVPANCKVGPPAAAGVCGCTVPHIEPGY